MNHDEYAAIAAGDPLQYLVDNFAPQVIGLEKAKRALIMSLASGEDGERERRRIHVCLWGPPGTAKTLLLQAAARQADTSVLSPRTSIGGMTIDFRGGKIGIIGKIHDTPYQLFPIDEMEKLEPEVLDQLLTAMESGVIQYAGSRGSGAIPAHIRVIAAVNSTEGLSRELVDRFDYQIKIPAPSRAQAHQVVHGITRSFMTKRTETGEPERFVVREFLEEARKHEPAFTSGERRLAELIFRMLINTETENKNRLRKFPGILRTAYTLARIRNTDLTAYRVLEAIALQYPDWHPRQLDDITELLEFRSNINADKRNRGPTGAS